MARPRAGPTSRVEPTSAAPRHLFSRAADYTRAATRPLIAHPRATQRGAIGGLFGGIGIFVVLCTTMTSTVTAAPATLPAAAPPVTSRQAAATVAPSVTPMPVRAALGAPATNQSRKNGSKNGGKDASADHGVISGLAANGIPSVALNAYRVAAARMANVQPSCGIPWYLLAGIGREESDHGRYDGAVLHADGVSTPRIIGPALDGIHWDFIPAPANGLALDGDAKYAHALGPMQFIPSTWATYGADANGDGSADIFNINDAALGAARYLCAAGGDLTTIQGKTRAVLAYNHNSQYLAQVLALADAYRKGITITGLPVGITSGQLPKLVDNGYIPPANPAAPPAAAKSTACPTPSPSRSASASKSGAKASPSGHRSASPSKTSTSTSCPTTKSSTTTARRSTPTKPSPSRSTSPTKTTSPSGGSSPSTSVPPSPVEGSGSQTSPSAAPAPTKTCNQVEQLLGCKAS